MHKLRLIGVLMVIPSCAVADLADIEPEELCGLLDSFGIVMTAYVPPTEDERPLCYILDQPYSESDSGYKYLYRNIAHFKRDHVRSLFLEIRGHGSKILGQEPHVRFTEMSRVILSRLFSDEIVSDTLLAIQSISPGYNRNMTAEGLNIQLISLDYARHGIPDFLYIRISVSNICEYNPTDTVGKSQCIAKFDAPRGSLLGEEGNRDKP